MPTKGFSKSDLFFQDENGDYQKIISIEEFELPLEDIEPVDGLANGTFSLIINFGIPVEKFECNNWRKLHGFTMKRRKRK